MLDPATAFSEEPNESACSRAYETKLSCYEWLDQPGNELPRKKFGIAMAGGTYNDDALASQGSHPRRKLREIATE